mmetsp:Transcript_2865/g.7865  ORF Transcript_2865/g.7865 Transcript_2865/m.7865 type:complete len:463 (+) Transcript_2865:128-1516(+)
MAKRIPKISNRKRRQRSSKLRKLVRCVAFIPLFCLLLERVYLFPFDGSKLSGYLDVERVAVTSTIKTKQENDILSSDLPSIMTTEKVRKSLEALTQPFRVADTSSIRCQSGGTKIIAGYHHLGVKNAFEANFKVLTRRRQKIPKILHQQGASRCIPSALYDLHGKWERKLSTDNENNEEWSVYFHTEDAMTRLFRSIVGTQGEMENSKHLVSSKIDNEFPQLRQMIRNCVENGSFSKQLLWRFLCLYIYGGMYVDLESGISPSYHDNAKIILRENYDTVLLWTTSEDHQQDSFRPEINENHAEFEISTNIMAASPGHPLMYFAVQHALLELKSGTYSKEYSAIDSKRQLRSITTSNILKKALFDFLEGYDVESKLLRSNAPSKFNLNDSFQKMVYHGTSNATVIILSSRAIDIDGFMNADQSSSFQQRIPFGKGRADLGKLGGNSPSCLRKLLVDASKMLAQ